MKMEDQVKKTGEGGAGNPDTGNRETFPAPDRARTRRDQRATQDHHILQGEDRGGGEPFSTPG